MLSEKPWTIDAVLAFVVGVFGSILLGMMLLALLDWAHLVPEANAKVVSIVVGTITFHGACFGFAIPFLRSHGMTWNEAFGLRSSGLGRTVAYGLLTSLGALPIAWFLGMASSRLLRSQEFKVALQTQVQLLQDRPSIVTLVSVSLIAVVVAPLAEELFFRGILYPALKRTGRPQVALWGSSLLFASMHSNVMLFVPLLFLGCVLALLYETSDNLLAPILAHSVFNLVNLVLLLLYPQMAQST